MYCWRAGSIERSRSNGCEYASSSPDCRLGSKLLIGLFVVVRAVSQETLHAPPAHGARPCSPDDANQSSTSTPCSPASSVEGGVTTLDRPSVVESIGTYAARVWAVRAASTSVSRRTTTRSGLFSMARRTASSSVSGIVASAAGCREPRSSAAAESAAMTANPTAIRTDAFRNFVFIQSPPRARASVPARGSPWMHRPHVYGRPACKWRGPRTA